MLSSIGWLYSVDYKPLPFYKTFDKCLQTDHKFFSLFYINAKKQFGKKPVIIRECWIFFNFILNWVVKYAIIVYLSCLLR